MARTRRDRTRGDASANAPKGGGEGSARRAASRPSAPPPLTFTRWTGIFGGAGLVSIVAGFILLAQGSMALAPALLVLGFLVLVPIALVK